MRVRVLFLLLVLSMLPCFADTTQLSYPTTQTVTVQQIQQPPITQPQNVAFEACTKMFRVSLIHNSQRVEITYIFIN